jgi:hypothetical protein
MTTYIGIRRGEDTFVTVICGEQRGELDIERSLAVRNHSPTGFEWGYNGSGPAQLSLAILLDVLKDEEKAVQHYQEFKGAFVSKWQSEWTITEDEIFTWLEGR